ncbi:MAG TPA: glutamate--tRNA ligase [Acidobacteriaceae bacterium]|nr:glutamate--tRNA ligase [Acidobacteriaceae bacterium]
MQTPKTRVRFAPSPTGLLHVGNARTALYNWLFARHTGGEFLLRIEDTDLERSEARHEVQLFEDLRWLGLNWDEGPGIAGAAGRESDGPHAPYRQSERLEIYRQCTHQLLREGKAYRCFCTQEELEEERRQSSEQQGGHQGGHLYSGKCRNLSPAEAEERAAAGQPFAVRLAIPEEPLRFHDIVRGEVEFASEAVSDPILVRSSGMPVYNYVVTVDDALMEITHVIRGDDHLSNTPKQVAIYRAFGWKLPQFAHLSTILGPDRERLSKRHGSTSIASFREMGILPAALTNYLALLGWGAEGGKRETFTLPELVQHFKLERVTPSPAVFDANKLHWLNRHYMKETPVEEIETLAWPYFAAQGWLPDREAAGTEIREWFARVLALYLPAVDQLDQLPQKAAALWGFDPERAKNDPENAPLLTSEAGVRVVAAFRKEVDAAPPPLTAESFKAIVNQVKTATGAKGKELFHPIRILITGAHSGPEFDKLIPLIEGGSQLALPKHVPGVRERVELFGGSAEGA